MDVDLDYIEAPVAGWPSLYERLFGETKTHRIPRPFRSLRQNLIEQFSQAILNILVVYPVLVLIWYFLYKYFASKNDDKMLDEVKKEIKFLKAEVKMLKKEVKMLKKQVEAHNGGENRDERIQGLEMNLGMGDQLLDQDENGEG